MDKGEYIESKFINAYCQTNNYKHFVIRVDHYSKGWYMVAGFLTAADTSQKKHYNIFNKNRKKETSASTQQDDFTVEETVNVEGRLFVDGSYSCPYCGNTGIVKCGSCGRICCRPDDSQYFKCICGKGGKLSGTIQSLSAVKNGAEKVKKK